MDRDKKELISKAMAEFLEIPKDLVLDMPKISIVGRDEIYIENHKGIIEYDSNRIRINLARGFVELEGRDFTIKNLLPDEMNINGILDYIRYHD